MVADYLQSPCTSATHEKVDEEISTLHQLLDFLLQLFLKVEEEMSLLNSCKDVADVTDKNRPSATITYYEPISYDSVADVAELSSFLKFL